MIEIHTDPTPRELRWFGLALMAFFAIVGVVVRYHVGPNPVSRALWLTGATLGVVYYVVPPARRPVFVAWSYLTYPLGWLLSHLVLIVVFYGLLTPIGLVRRLLGADPMSRELDRDRESYWEARSDTPRPSRYFRQF